MPHRYLADLAPADAAFQAWGATLEELFQAAAEALLGVMVGDLNAIVPRIERSIALESEALDLLLLEFLEEFIYRKDAEALLLRPRDLHVTAEPGRVRIAARLLGEPLEPERHPLLMDVKAVTLHRLEVKETGAGWEATVVLDL